MKQSLVQISAALVIALVASGAPAYAQEASAWARDAKSMARLVAAGGRDMAAGVEITLAPGAVTYWRAPGEAGVPPRFSFEGSANLARAEVFYPAPKRIAEPDGEVFGYEGGVTFPISVTPIEPAEPVGLSLHMDYAACERICVPARADLALTLAPSAPPSRFSASLAAAFASVPSQAEPGRVSVTRNADGWLVRPRADDLFVEAPEGWFFQSRKRADGFVLTLAQRPPGAPDAPPPALRLTFVDGDRAFEAVIDLDAAALKH